jgi:hypothetical protein
MYNSRCETEAAQRSEVRAKRDFERKNYKPVEYDFSWLYAKNEVEAVVAPEPWQPTWNRNLYCEKCWALTTPGAGRVECITCPVVQHVGCAFQYSDEVPDVWMCDDCVNTMEDSINRQKKATADKRAVERQQRSAVLLQRQMRMFVKARFFRKLMYYVCFFQGLVRGELGSQSHRHHSQEKDPRRLRYCSPLVSPPYRPDRAQASSRGKISASGSPSPTALLG